MKFLFKFSCELQIFYLTNEMRNIQLNRKKKKKILFSHLKSISSKFYVINFYEKINSTRKQFPVGLMKEIPLN